MTDELLLQNLLFWTLQFAAIAAVAALLPRLLRLHPAAFRLRWMQAALLVGLLLPVFATWHREIILIEAGTTSGVTIATGAVRAVPPTFNPATAILWTLGTGIAMRLMWMAFGFLRLRRYRLRSVEITESLWTEVFPGADLRESADVTGPVTFGVIRPVVLLPVAFDELRPSQQEAVLWHEIIHVRRKDWLWMVGEELLRAALWFQPAVWWLTSEIRLAREEVVDNEVIQQINGKEEYVDALLAFAGVAPSPLATMAPGFIRRHHLKRRVINILKEVRMSRTRYVSTVLTATAVLAGVCWFVTNTLPLNAAPQTAPDAPGVTVDMGGAQLMHRSPVAAPVTGVDGAVVAQVRLDQAGNVADASIISGPDELRKSVLQSILNWHFARSEGGSTRQITVHFKSMEAAKPATVSAERGLFPPGSQQRTLKQINITGIPEPAKQELAATVSTNVGAPFTPETAQAVSAAARKADEHLVVTPLFRGADDISLTISPAGSAGTPTAAPPSPLSAGASSLRVSGMVQQANLVSQITPVYPPTAKAARVQGTVRLDVVVGKDGQVTNLRLISGPPLLVAAAMEAARQWIYRPTLLNDNPVEVASTIDINFSLAETGTPQAQ